MRNAILVAAACALLLALILPRIEITAPSFPHVVKTAHPGGSGSSSATPLRDHRGFAWYLTAGHCLPVATVGGQEVVKAWKHPSADIALLKVRGTVGVGSHLALRQPRLGDRLTAMGYGAGMPLQITDGRQGGKPKSMTCPIIFGASGGAVLNEDGELVGIVMSLLITGGWATAPIPHVSFYTPVVDLKFWFNSIIGV